MKPLIDGDVIRYEVASCGQFIDNGELIIRNFDGVEELLHLKIEEICEAVGATEPPILFLTNDAKLQDRLNRRAVKEGRPTQEYIPNFRHEVATVKPYKGTRKGEKPYHFDNITTYMMANFDVRIANGYEADDALGAYQCAHENTVICSRDKDLRMIPGMQYSWECGKQPEWGPEEVEDFGYITLSDSNILKGVGIKFFFSQMLTGDTVDNIPGLPKCGPVKAYKLLEDCETEKQCVDIVRQAYKDKYAEKAPERLQEQAQLLWIAREIVDGQVVAYKPGGAE